MKVRLRDIAYARSGDKGACANVGVIAREPGCYATLVARLTADTVHDFFRGLGVTRVTRYELPNLHALNLILHEALDGGGSLSLRIDAQGKALGQLLLEMELDLIEGRTPTPSCQPIEDQLRNLATRAVIDKELKELFEYDRVDGSQAERILHGSGIDVCG